MRWEGNRQSDNVEDRRDEGAGGGGGGGGMRLGGGKIGLGSVAIALVAYFAFGINPMTTLGVLGGGGEPEVQQPSGPAKKPPANDPQAAFVSTVLASTEDAWTQVFAAGKAQYQAPRLVMFRGATPTACGTGQTAMGPFYCPGDQRVYIDLAFYETLQKQLGSPGDFAQAYVVAHEVGHHVQHLLGITDKVDAMRARQSKAQANASSVRLELQADCFAGVWAFHSQSAKQWLDQGDVAEALNAASHIGDDALQQASQGRVVPESFTHGSSQQRVGWFQRGMAGGRVQDCNTFEARQL
ncbi:MAG: neutral zinc metallopeptidase [Vitreoscilla sp.]|nr:neutral zinc metallopeptidase [Vitreoscilla sp.]MBP6676897.1 neutral zinc metallopeptidase [Vitreoscilla sp.]